MKLHRMVLEWAGPQVTGRAVTVLHFDGTEEAAPPVAAIKTAFTSLAPGLPTGVSIVIPNGGDSIDDTTGDLDGFWSSTAGGTINGTGAATAAAGVGAVIAWSTGTIVSGTKGPRRLRGRTFLVPVTSTAYGNDGKITTPMMSTLNTVAGQIFAAGAFGIWHRPTTPGGSDGSSGVVTSYRVSPKVAMLSSRRD